MSTTTKDSSAKKMSGTQTEGKDKEHTWFTNFWSKIPFRIRTILPPVLFFLFVLIAMIIISYASGTDIANSVGIAGSVVSIFSAILAFLTWFNLQKLQTSRPRQTVSYGNMSAILIVDIGAKMIEGNVIPFCQGNINLKNIAEGEGFKKASIFKDINEVIKDTEFNIKIPKSDGRIIIVVRPNIDIKREYDTDIEQIINDPARQFYKAFGLINEALHENGISELHVFCSSPLFVSFFLAEILSNQYKVNIYHYVPNNNDSNKGTYMYIGVMDHKLYQ